MSAGRRPYIAVLLFESTTRAPGPPLYREDTTLVFAASREGAQAEADRHARAQETTYESATGDEVTLRFLQAVDLVEALDDDLSTTSDLYCRHFRDIDAYRRFEPLLDGEPL